MPDSRPLASAAAVAVAVAVAVGVEHPNKRVGSFSGKKSHPKKEGTVALVCGSKTEC